MTANDPVYSYVDSLAYDVWAAVFSVQALS